MRNPLFSGTVIGATLQAACFLGGFTAQAVQVTASPATGQTESKPLREYGPEDHDVVTPKVIYAPDPEYSDKARRKKLSGSCVFSLLVDVRGNPQDVQLVKSLGDGLSPKQRSAAASLDENALAAVRQYRFKPATLQGKPVPYRVKIEVDFRIY